MLQAKNGLRALAALLTYAVTVNGRVDVEAIEQTLLAEVGPEAAEVVVSTVQQWHDRGLELGLARGREEGREEGREVGREEGQQQLLLSQLRFKFRVELPAAVVERVQGAGAEQLTVWGQRLLVAQRLAEVFDDAAEPESPVEPESPAE